MVADILLLSNVKSVRFKLIHESTAEVLHLLVFIFVGDSLSSLFTVTKPVTVKSATKYSFVGFCSNILQFIFITYLS